MSKRALRYASEADMPEGMRKLLRPGQVSATVWNSLTVQPPARHARHEAGRMNKTEAMYNQHLAYRKHAGDISWYAFEAIKLRLAKNTFLTIDFSLVTAAGELELHEVKGRKGDGYWAEEDARIKLKVAAEMFPWRIVIAWPKKGGGWCTAGVG